MKTIYIDFAEIGDYDDFYTQLKEKIEIPAYFGDNLDALYDIITGDISLPLYIEFVNMSVDQLEIFEDLLETLEEVDDKVEKFSFTYFLEQFDDIDEDIK